jgi:hypothetical protein
MYQTTHITLFPSPAVGHGHLPLVPRCGASHAQGTDQAENMGCEHRSWLQFQPLSCMVTSSGPVVQFQAFHLGALTPNLA